MKAEICLVVVVVWLVVSLWPQAVVHIAAVFGPVYCCSQLKLVINSLIWLYI